MSEFDDGTQHHGQGEDPTPLSSQPSEPTQANSQPSEPMQASEQTQANQPQSEPTESTAINLHSEGAHHSSSQSNKKTTSKRGLSTVGTLGLGLLCAVAGAFFVVAVLWSFGVLSFDDDTSSSSSSSSSSYTQSIEIIASQEDTTVAEAVAAKVMPSVVAITVNYAQGTGAGSGVIYDTDGNIITNYHVIEDAVSISVSYDGETYVADVVGYDASSDLAVIHVDFGDTAITPIEQGDSDELVVGEWVMAVGNPYGLEQSVSTGIVSALYRSTMLTLSSGNTLYTNLIQTDAAINPGNSGGALVNSEGQLIGITTLNASSDDSGASAGVAFAIPGNYAMSVADTIIAGETVEHAYIGVSVQTVSNVATSSGSYLQGAYIASVVSGGPADEAGIQQGDIVIAVNGESISSADALILAIRSYEVGETVTLTVWRSSAEVEVEVVLGSDADASTTTDSSSDNWQDLFGSN